MPRKAQTTQRRPVGQVWLRVRMGARKDAMWRRAWTGALRKQFALPSLASPCSSSKGSPLAGSQVLAGGLECCWVAFGGGLWLLGRSRDHPKVSLRSWGTSCESWVRAAGGAAGGVVGRPGREEVGKPGLQCVGVIPGGSRGRVTGAVESGGKLLRAAAYKSKSPAGPTILGTLSVDEDAGAAASRGCWRGEGEEGARVLARAGTAATWG